MEAADSFQTQISVHKNALHDTSNICLFPLQARRLRLAKTEIKIKKKSDRRYESGRKFTLLYTSHKGVYKFSKKKSRSHLKFQGQGASPILVCSDTESKNRDV